MDASDLTAERINAEEKCGRTAHGGRSRQLDVEVRAAAACDLAILFTGTAAREVARRVHAGGRSRPGRFRVIDCGGPEALLEQRLFYALRNDSSGTLFLEEVGRLSFELQQRLLHALDATGQGRRARPRVMASTSESLLQRALEGTFNEQLFYRLNTIHVILPPDLGDI